MLRIFYIFYYIYIYYIILHNESIFDYFAENDKQQPHQANPQVDILPLPQLQKLLLTVLPRTRVKILKIPFHATWRQSILDTAAQ